MSEVEGIKSNKKLGGWLRFFKFINIMWFISFPLAAISIVYIFFIPPIKTPFSYEEALYLLRLLPNLIFSILILKTIPLQDKSTPNKLKYLIYFEFYAHSLVFVISKLAFSYNYIQEEPEILSIYMSVVYVALWHTYLVKSKRVLEFYGSNATKSITS